MHSPRAAWRSSATETVVVASGAAATPRAPSVAAAGEPSAARVTSAPASTSSPVGVSPGPRPSSRRPAGSGRSPAAERLDQVGHGRPARSASSGSATRPVSQRTAPASRAGGTAPRPRGRGGRHHRLTRNDGRRRSTTMPPPTVAIVPAVELRWQALSTPEPARTAPGRPSAEARQIIGAIGVVPIVEIGGVRRGGDHHRRPGRSDQGELDGGRRGDGVRPSHGATSLATMDSPYARALGCRHGESCRQSGYFFGEFRTDVRRSRHGEASSLAKPATLRTLPRSQPQPVRTSGRHRPSDCGARGARGALPGRGRVLAGASGLDRIVTRLNVMEVPDILPWVKPHELLLTTGYPLRDDPDALVALVGELDDRGLAALAIKLHRYLDEVPAGAARRGRPAGLPDHRVPAGRRLRRRPQRGARHAAQPAGRARRPQRGGAPGAGLGRARGRRPGRPRRRAGRRSSAARCSSPRPTAGWWPRPATPTSVAGSSRSPAFDRSGRFRVEAASTGTLDDGDHCAVVPIVAGRVDHGRIVTFSDRRSPTPTCTAWSGPPPWPRSPSPRASPSPRWRTSTGPTSCATCSPGGSRTWPRRCAHAGSLGWDVDRPMVVAVAELDPGQVPSSVSGHGAAPGAGALRHRLADGDAGARPERAGGELQHRGGRAARRRARGRPGPAGRPTSTARSPATAAAAGSRSRSACPGSRPTPAELPRAYEQARTAVRIGRRLQGPGARATFDQLGAYRLLALIPDSGELRGYVADVLGELAARHRRGGRPAAHPGGAARHQRQRGRDRAAAALPLQHAALPDREAGTLVGPFTTNAALRLDLSLALRVRQMGGADPTVRPRREGRAPRTRRPACLLRTWRHRPAPGA